jgi:hypothetical protein
MERQRWSHLVVAALGGAILAGCSAQSPATAGLIAQAVSTSAVATATPSTQASVDYMAYIMPRFLEIENAYALLEDQLGQYSRNRGVYFDSNWRANTNIALAALGVFGLEVQRYKPVPRELVPLNDTITALGADLVSPSGDLERGINRLDAPSISRGDARLVDANARLNEARAELAKLQSYAPATVAAVTQKARWRPRRPRYRLPLAPRPRPRSRCRRPRRPSLQHE